MSYQRLIECPPAVLVPLAAYLPTRLETTHGLALIDSLHLPVCHHRRIHSHRVFAGVAQRARSSLDWCYGLQLHFVINEPGALLAFRLTPGNVDDRTPAPDLAAGCGASCSEIAATSARSCSSSYNKAGYNGLPS